MISGQRLEPHAHNSDNTHRVIFGLMIIHKTTDPADKRYIYKDQEGDVPSEECYYATAGPDGCLFVEGHMSLSPNSALRFENRGTLVPAMRGERGFMKHNEK